MASNIASSIELQTALTTPGSHNFLSWKAHDNLKVYGQVYGQAPPQTHVSPMHLVNNGKKKKVILQGVFGWQNRLYMRLISSISRICRPQRFLQPTKYCVFINWWLSGAKRASSQLTENLPEMLPTHTYNWDVAGYQKYLRHYQKLRISWAPFSRIPYSLILREISLKIYLEPGVQA